MRIRISGCAAGIICLLIITGIAAAQQPVRLSTPRIRGDVMRALNTRTSLRGFSDHALSRRQIGEVVWAAFGINDPATGSRTAASAFNSQEIDIYAIMESGAYRYNPVDHELLPVSEGDHRGLVALQDYAADAPLHLLYVADYQRSEAAFRGDYKALTVEMAHFHAGLIAQNVYLYCADEGLGTVVRSSIDTEGLREVLGLGDRQAIIASQAVGYPAE